MEEEASPVDAERALLEAARQQSIALVNQSFSSFLLTLGMESSMQNDVLFIDVLGVLLSTHALSPFQNRYIVGFIIYTIG